MKLKGRYDDDSYLNDEDYLISRKQLQSTPYMMILVQHMIKRHKPIRLKKIILIWRMPCLAAIVQDLW